MERRSEADGVQFAASVWYEGVVGQAELNLIRPSKNRSNTQNNLKIEESSVFNLAKVFRHLLRLAQTGNHLFLGGVLSTVDGFGVSRFPG